MTVTIMSPLPHYCLTRLRFVNSKKILFYYLHGPRIIILTDFTFSCAKINDAESPKVRNLLHFTKNMYQVAALIGQLVKIPWSSDRKLKLVGVYIKSASGTGLKSIIVSSPSSMQYQVI